MKREPSRPPQFSLILRILCGGYLVYTAWDLRGAFQEEKLYILAAAVFAVVGIVLCVHSVLKLIRGEYTGTDDPAQGEEAREDAPEEETNGKNCEANQ